MTRILVTGASGLLGLSLCLQYAGQHELLGVTNAHGLPGAPFPVITANLTQPSGVEKLIDLAQPEWIIHCAALANIDQAEAQPQLAQRINAEVPGEFAAAARRTGVKLVHISTDAVFDGQRGDYTEEDAPNPLSVYASTKLAGERVVAEANPDAIIARVNFYGWSLSGKRSLAEFFFNNLVEGRPAKGFTDIYFCPLQVNQLAEILLRMAELKLSGVYHVLSCEALSKYDFGCRIARQFGLDDTLVQPVSWKDGSLTAVRSPFLNLRTEKLAAALGAPLPDQAPGLQRLAAQYHEGYCDQLRAFAAQGA